MPSFDTVLEADLVKLKNAVENSAKEIGTRFDFKGSSAAVELKDKEITLYADSDFQIAQVRVNLLFCAVYWVLAVFNVANAVFSSRTRCASASSASALRLLRETSLSALALRASATRFFRPPPVSFKPSSSVQCPWPSLLSLIPGRSGCSG